MGKLMIAALYLALLSNPLQTNPTVLYRDPRNDLELLDCRTFHGLSQAKSTLTFDFEGKPLTLKLNSAGLTVNCLRLDGSASDFDKPKAVLRSMNATGNSSFHLDTAAKERYEIANKMLSAPSPSQSVTSLFSDKFNYVGSPADGTLTVPGAVHIVSRQTGPGAAGSSVKSYVNDLDVTGSSAVVTLNPLAATNESAIKTGVLQGPVVLKWVRHELASTGAPTESTLDGKADSLTMDLVSAKKTIILEGHVRVTASGGLRIGETNVPRIVITLDDQLQPIGFDADGGSVTRIHVGGGPR
jgi:hypothetical protein